jgi:nucleoside-diphosphate-sugar epimerase
MRIFVTGASGWIGSATVTDLIGAGHQVLGLARSDDAATVVESLGAEAHRGTLADPARLREAAAACDGVVHLGYNHDFSDMAGAAATDRTAVEALGSALAGTGKPLVVASGVLGLAAGRVATEQDQPEPSLHPRIASLALAMGFAERGVRSVGVRFAPTVHGPGDHGFVATLVQIARATGVSAYVGDGDSCWPAVHRLDAAHLVRLAVESAPPGSSLHAVAEEGVPTRIIARAIGAGLGLPAVSVPVDRATEHFGWLGRFFALDTRASNAWTREQMGWTPRRPGLLEDLAGGSYFTRVETAG